MDKGIKVETPPGWLILTQHLFKRWVERTKLDELQLLEHLCQAKHPTPHESKGINYFYFRKFKPRDYVEHLVSQGKFLFIVINNVVVTMFRFRWQHLLTKNCRRQLLERV